MDKDTFLVECLVGHERPSGSDFHKGWIYPCFFTTVSDTFLVSSRCGEGYVIYDGVPFTKEGLVDSNGIETFKTVVNSCLK